MFDIESAVFLCILGFILLFTGVGPVVLIADLVLFIWWYMQTEKAREKLKEYDTEFRAVANETDFTKAESERLKTLVEKIDFVERYRP